jgi:TonB family protein
MMFRLVTLLGITTTCATCFPQADSAQTNRVTVEQQVMDQHLIHRVDPVYPPLAQQGHIQGTVIFRIIVDKDGAVKNPIMVSGHPLLVPAAQEAVRQWRYDPFLVDGKPVEVQSVVNVRVPVRPPSPGVEQFRENARLHPDDADAHYRLGVALIEGNSDQNDEAIAELGEAVRLRPNHPETHTRLAEALARKHKVDQAIQEYREAIRLNSDAPEPHSKLASLLLGQVDYDSAVAEYRELVRLKPEDKQAYQLLGMALYHKGPITAVRLMKTSLMTSTFLAEG